MRLERLSDYRGVGLEGFHHTYVRMFDMHAEYTVKPVYIRTYIDHSRDQVFVVSVDRWSLYRGVLALLKGPMEQPAV